MAITLNDPFHLEGFEDKRQNILIALVACSPKTTAPCVVTSQNSLQLSQFSFFAEQYYNTHFSLSQKFIILTALAMGARELAGLAVPNLLANSRRIDFPSKMLPPQLHQKYTSFADTPRDGPSQLNDAMTGVRNLLLSKGAKQAQETVPELIREKRLRVGTSKRGATVTEVGSLGERQSDTEKISSLSTPVIPFRDIAAEYFLMPLINRFWQHLQDASVREERAIFSGTRYRGAGTGMILSPMALEKFLMTIALLLHAARHSPLFLAVLSAEAIELALTIGSRHPSRPDDNTISQEEADFQDGSQQEASVVGAALEVCLVSLDIAIELDRGRTLILDKSQLLFAAGEWARMIFEVENRGGQVAGGQGGMREGRIKAAAAGVVVKVAEIGEKWGRSGLLG